MTESDRELLIDYLARERAETALCHEADYRADLGWWNSDEDYWYRVFRKVGIPQWDMKPFEKMTGQELLDLYVLYYDVNPDEHLMDAWVTVTILDLALSPVLAA